MQEHWGGNVGVGFLIPGSIGCRNIGAGTLGREHFDSRDVEVFFFFVCVFFFMCVFFVCVFFLRLFFLCWGGEGRVWWREGRRGEQRRGKT